MTARAPARAAAAVMALVVLGSACGTASDDNTGGSAAETVDDVEPEPIPKAPTLGEMTVADGCAEVRLADGTVWADSCLKEELRPIAVVSETFSDVELALLRFTSRADLIRAHPDSVLFVQDDGWILVESPTFDFVMTFGAGADEVDCRYNPVSIDCS